jgi:hypothetical protein
MYRLAWVMIKYGYSLRDYVQWANRGRGCTDWKKLWSCTGFSVRTSTVGQQGAWLYYTDWTESEILYFLNPPRSLNRWPKEGMAVQGGQSIIIIIFHLAAGKWIIRPSLWTQKQGRHLSISWWACGIDSRHIGISADKHAVRELQQCCRSAILEYQLVSTR